MGQMSLVRGRATTVQTGGGVTRVRYHHTDVVVFDAERIILNTGGWRTVTTKARMNQTSSQFDLGYYVSQRDFAWYVTFKGKEIPFEGLSVTLKR